MIRPPDLVAERPIHLHNGVISTTSSVWSILMAAAAGDTEDVDFLQKGCRELLTCEYDYTAPLHLAVLGSHVDTVRYLVGHRALDPTYKNHPFRDSLLTLAQDRGNPEVIRLLEETLANHDLTHVWGDAGGIEYGIGVVQQKFQDAVDAGDTALTRTMLLEHPDLLAWPDYFWGEGILSMPAKDGNFAMIELLFEFGAKVPDFSKWGARYYFKHYEVAKLLLRNDMNPDHMNWREFTLLHDMVFTNDLQKAKLLIDYGADLDATDDEYASTPLGYAARWGNRDMVQLLLECGADPNGARTGWALPLRWAISRGHTEIADDLRAAGALD